MDSFKFMQKIIIIAIILVVYAKVLTRSLYSQLLVVGINIQLKKKFIFILRNFKINKIAKKNWKVIEQNLLSTKRHLAHMNVKNRMCTMNACLFVVINYYYLNKLLFCVVSFIFIISNTILGFCCWPVTTVKKE